MALALVDGKLVDLVPQKKVLVFTRANTDSNKPETFLGEAAHVAADLGAAGEFVKTTDVAGNTVVVKEVEVLAPAGDTPVATPPPK
jgi:hypothetical protein